MCYCPHLKRKLHYEHECVKCQIDKRVEELGLELVTWKQLITYEMDNNDESWDDIVEVRLEDSDDSYDDWIIEKFIDGDGWWYDVEFYNGHGGREGIAFGIWTKDWIYFPIEYDGSEGVKSLPLHPSLSFSPKHI